MTVAFNTSQGKFVGCAQRSKSPEYVNFYPKTSVDSRVPESSDLVGTRGRDALVLQVCNFNLPSSGHT